MQRKPGMPSQPWVIILAGGEGTRLAPLTRALYGVDLPKQFAVLDGHLSLLQRTVERATAIGAAERTLVVASTQRSALAAAQLAPYPGVRLLLQPANRDTGPGLLFPLAYVHAHAPSTARVVVLPSDHHLPNPRPLIAALGRTEAYAELRKRVTLVGVDADRPETEYGWILPGHRLAGHDRHAGWEVRRFFEKPSHKVALRLRSRGALWNTFIATGRISAFWDLARSRLPDHVAAFEAWAARCDEPDSADRLRALYAELPPASWSQDVVARTRPHQIAVVAMAGSGWSDWGSPQRVLDSLAGQPALDHLLARVRAPTPTAPEPVA